MEIRLELFVDRCEVEAKIRIVSTAFDLSQRSTSVVEGYYHLEQP
jgi:hypothetical protein